MINVTSVLILIMHHVTPTKAGIQNFMETAPMDSQRMIAHAPIAGMIIPKKSA